MKSRVAGCLIALLLAASFASAQEQRGLITGTVFDAQGAVVPGAAVTVTDEGTGAVYNGKTTGEGTFTIPGLPSGSYSVVIVAPGFSCRMQIAHFTGRAAVHPAVLLHSLLSLPAPAGMPLR